LGLRRHGYVALADELCRRLLATYCKFRGFPEFVRGDDAEGSPTLNEFIVQVRDGSGRINTVEQPPQRTQAWTAAAILAIKISNGVKWRSRLQESLPLPLEVEILEGMPRTH
jgi:hypothetical protein